MPHRRIRPADRLLPWPWSRDAANRTLRLGAAHSVFSAPLAGSYRQRHLDIVLQFQLRIDRWRRHAGKSVGHSGRNDGRAFIGLYHTLAWGNSSQALPYNRAPKDSRRRQIGKLSSSPARHVRFSTGGRHISDVISQMARARPVSRVRV